MSLTVACRLFGISRQAIYKRRQSYKHQQRTLSDVKTMVIKERMELPRLGTRKLYSLLSAEFRAQGIKIGRDKLFDFLRSEHMLVKRRKSYTKTTWSKHWMHKHPNLIKGMIVSGPEQLWVSDITYIKTNKQYCYLSLITDAYSRKIVGYHVSDDLKTEGVLSALKMAISGRIYEDKLIHHSDKGMQYCAEPYQSLLEKYGISCSMTDGYDCYQNALAERMNGILKEEFISEQPQDIDQLRTIVTQSVYLYNHKRPHLSLKMRTPESIHRQKILTEKTIRSLS